jgi:serine protease Do
VSMTKPGATVPVQILRDGKDKTINVTVGTMPRDKNAVADTGAAAPSKGADALGLTVEGVDASTRSQLGLQAGEGVAISNVTGSVAAQAGLQPGDVILMVNQKKVGSADAFRAATAGVKAGDTVLLLVRRGDTSNFIALTVPDEAKDG